jgi:hypothetical protein
LLDRRHRRNVRPVHPPRRAKPRPVRQRPRVRGQGRPRMDRSGRLSNSVHRARQSLRERLLRELQCPPAGRATQRRDLLHARRGQDRDRGLADELQRREAALRTRLQASRARGRAVAGCATPTSSAGHPDGRVSAVHELTLSSDHSMGPGQNASCSTGTASAPTRKLECHLPLYRRLLQSQP